MTTHPSSHLSPQAPPQRRQAAVRVPQPVVLLTFAKLVLVAGALAILTPLWLDHLRQLGTNESWYALRLLALGGGAVFITFAVLVVKLASGLFSSWREA